MAAPVSRFLRIALVVSLGLNLAVAGLAVGMLVRGHAAGPPGRVDFSLGPLGRALTEKDRAAVAREFRSRGDVRPPGPRDRRQDLRELVAVLTAEPLDRDALERILERSRDRGRRAMEAGQSALIARIAEMTPTERIVLAERLKAEVRRPRGGGRD